MRRIDFPEWREVLTQAELPERLKSFFEITLRCSGRQDGLAGVESGLPDHVTGFAVPAIWSSLTALFTIYAVILRPEGFSVALSQAVWACYGVRPTSGRS